MDRRIVRHPGLARSTRKVASPASEIKYPNGYTLDQTMSCIHRGNQVGSYGGG